jgi:Holliday junction resolvase RusA-like endonuclease
MSDPFVLQVTLPWPSRKLSPNFRGHWSQKAKATKAARTEAAYELIRQSTPIGIYMLRQNAKLHVHYDFAPPNRRRMDLDNLVASHKAAADGLADVLDIDDSQWRISCEFVEPVKGGAVQVTIKGAT